MRSSRQEINSQAQEIDLKTSKVGQSNEKMEIGKAYQ
jgi:hypothetical protein